MAYRMAQIPSEFKGHICCYKWQNASNSPSASADLLVYYSSWCMLQ